MKKQLAFIFLTGISTISHSAESIFTIDNVGMSRNTKSVFIETKEGIPNTTCPANKLFRLDSSDTLADHLLSISLAAHAQNKTVNVGYETDECLHSGTVVRYIKILK